MISSENLMMGYLAVHRYEGVLTIPECLDGHTDGLNCNVIIVRVFKNECTNSRLKL